MSTPLAGFGIQVHLKLFGRRPASENDSLNGIYR
jgi:hypothetical protein